MNIDEIWCEVCGATCESGAEFEIVFSKKPVEIICNRCRDLMKSGSLRFDAIDKQGRPRYRTWIFEWRPGRLLPPPPKGGYRSKGAT